MRRHRRVPMNVKWVVTQQSSVSTPEGVRMNKASALAWFGEVEKRVPTARRSSGPRRVRDMDPYAGGYGAPESGDDDDDHEATRETAQLAFVMAAEQAIRRTFPPNDPVVHRWAELFKAGTPGAFTNGLHVSAAVALFREAHEILRSDRFETLIEGVRAETVGELVEQADAMLANGWLAAAMVTAGGAVESTLRHLCEHANPPITIDGHGSIEKYNLAIGKRRNDGIELLTANQSKMITAWGGLRNRAAHYPKEFSEEETKESVRNAIDGIRMFLGNVER